MREERGERRRGRPEHWIFLTQLYKLIYPDVAVLYSLAEVLTCLSCFDGDRERGGNGECLKAYHPDANDISNLEVSEDVQQKVEGK